MDSNARPFILGLGAAALALAIGGLLLLIYVEWIWFSDDANVHWPTHVLLVAWVAVAAATMFVAYRSARQNLAVVVIMALVLVPLTFVGLLALSHNNACFGGESYPLPDQWVLWGRECGR